MGDRQQHDSANEEERLPRQLGHPRAEQRLQQGQIRGEATRELARPMFGEEARRQSDKMAEDVLAQAGDDALGRRCQQKDLDEIHQALEREQHEQPDRDAVEE
jgi:hypothetical protein